MEEMLHRLHAEETLAACEKLWLGEDARARGKQLYEAAMQETEVRIVVLDDDPTGVQTVHDVDVVTDWTQETIAQELATGERMFFILTNSRSFSAEKTQAVHREIAKNTLAAAKAAGVEVLLISRGDSTLRGHYPLETQTLRQAMEQEGASPFAGELLCPFFQAGGRLTLNGVHYVREGEDLIPAAQTEFAQDKTFGYNHSYLPAYIQEKTAGQTPASEVILLSLEALRSLDLEALEEKLLRAQGYRYVVADALEEADVEVLAALLLRLRRKGRHYLIRSAADVPKVFGHVDSRPLLTREEIIGPDPTVGGMVLVGSHVKKTTEQLNCLRASSLPLRWIEFSVAGWASEEALAQETARATQAAAEAMEQGLTAVVYTSRDLVAPQGASAETMLAISVRISQALTQVVARLPLRPRFLIAKGGITSSDVGTKALQVRRARVLGQAQPGIPVWKTGPESLFPGLSYIIFPGNVGSADTLRRIVEGLA